MNGTEREDPVFVRHRRGGSLRLHTDRECPRIKSARKVSSCPRADYPDTPICSFCAGEVDTGSGDDSGPWETLEAMDPDDLVTDGGSVPWMFDVGECLLRQTPSARDRTYEIERRLTDDSGKRFYHVVRDSDPIQRQLKSATIVHSHYRSLETGTERSEATDDV